MPTYQYECDACGHAFEVFQSITAQRLQKCSECSQLKLQRLIGRGSGIIFKGSGFYETDYNRPSAPCGAQAGKDSKAGQEGAKPKGCPLKDPSTQCACPSQGGGSDGK